MKDQLKWVLNHMPKSDDQHLDVMSLPNVAKARSFHGSFPQYPSGAAGRYGTVSGAGGCVCEG